VQVTSDDPYQRARLPTPPEYVMRLERKHPRRDKWVPVCDSPCEAVVDRYADYRLVGPRVSASSAFQLPDRGDASVHARPGYPAAGVLGWTLVGVGATSTVAGGVVLSIPSSAWDPHDGVGVALLVPGLMLVGFGLVLQHHAHTRVGVSAREPRGPGPHFVGNGVLF
jgi:hypothetical protein